ncbi:MAG: DNA polymerase III subunit beta [Polyangiaceae bacterium]|nr:DNA polymerase III subunit beta [Polyangiaceae bacterium]
MELTILKRDFVRGLARTHGVADRKSSMPILSNVLLTTQGNEGLRLSATDLYLGVSTVVPAKVKKGGTLAISARTLFDVVKNLPDGEVELSVGENMATTLKAGKTRFKLPGLSGDDFPLLANPGEAKFAELDAELLMELIGLTSPSMSTDDTRPHLAGTLVEGEGDTIRMVTTDGHRLSKAEHRLKSDIALAVRMLVPHKGISELKKLLDDARSTKAKDEGPVKVGVATVAGTAFFQRGEHVLTVKLADEQFPPYARVIPQQQTRRIVVARVPMVEALRRISLVASDKSSGVQLKIEPGTLRVQSQNPDVGEGVEELDVDYAGDALSIGFNARYLLDALSALSHDEIAIELSGELDPGVLRPVGDGTDYVGVIMPMRI